jgi:hypothetical protein
MDSNRGSNINKNIELEGRKGGQDVMNAPSTKKIEFKLTSAYCAVRTIAVIAHDLARDTTRTLRSSCIGFLSIRAFSTVAVFIV